MVKNPQQRGLAQPTGSPASRRSRWGSCSLVMRDVGNHVLAVAGVFVMSTVGVAIDVLQLHEQQRGTVDEAHDGGAAPCSGHLIQDSHTARKWLFSGSSELNMRNVWVSISPHGSCHVTFTALRRGPYYSRLVCSIDCGTLTWTISRIVFSWALSGRLGLLDSSAWRRWRMSTTSPSVARPSVPSCPKVSVL